MKIVFMGTPDFAKVSLERLYTSEHEIQLVITNPDKPKGRGMKLVQSPVKEFATEKGIDILQPAKIKENKELVEKIKSYNPDLLVVVAYGKIIPNEILEIPKKGAINVHGSLLPKYRGAAPIQWAVINGDNVTGITTMFINDKMDEGDMLLKQEVTIGEYETVGELWERLASIGSDLLLKTVNNLENIKPIKQTGEATYAPLLNKKIAKIDWENKKAVEIKNLIRGLNPIMGAYSMLNNEKIKFWKTKVIPVEQFVQKIDEFSEFKNRLYKLEPGTIIYSDEKFGLYIKAIDDILEIEEIQVPNSKKMNIKDFLRGNSLQAGMIFE